MKKMLLMAAIIILMTSCHYGPFIGHEVHTPWHQVRPVAVP